MNIELDDNGLSRFLNRELARQLPYAQSVAMNGMAFETQKYLKGQVDVHLKTTKKFLQSSIQTEKATKKQLHAEVGFLDRVTFAEILLDGGTKRPYTSTHLAIPINVPRTRRGGIGKAKRPSALLQNRAYFIKEVNGTPFIFKKVGNSVTAMYVLKKKAEYRKSPYFPFDTLVNNYLAVNDNYEKRLYKALEQAFRTRRR